MADTVVCGNMDVEIELPDIVDKEKYRGMNSHDQEEYIQTKISEILDINEERGVTVSDINNNTPFSRTTIMKHLERLVSKREAYKIQRGKFTIYYSNGKPQHPEQRTQLELASGDVVRATFLNNSFGRFVYLENTNDNGVTGGGILIHRRDLRDLTDFVETVESKGEEYDARTKSAN